MAIQPEIKRFNGRDPSLKGKWYCIAKASVGNGIPLYGNGVTIYRYLHSNGSWFHFRAKRTITDDDKPISAFYDTREKAEEMLKRSSPPAFNDVTYTEIAEMMEKRDSNYDENTEN